jgi:hypothetical protein
VRIAVALLSALSMVALGGPATAQSLCDSARCEVASLLEGQCPCATAETHGHHVRCIARVAKALAADGTIPPECARWLKRCAARSTCGRAAGAVVCEIPAGTGTCRPGIGLCVEPPTTACSSDADCTRSRCTIAPSAARCVARGGTVAGRPSCCSPCRPSTPCGPGLVCNGERELCVSRYPVGPAIVYACEPVPGGCEADRRCTCAGPTLCTGAFGTCHDVGPNAIACECPLCQ